MQAPRIQLLPRPACGERAGVRGLPCRRQRIQELASNSFLTFLRGGRGKAQRALGFAGVRNRGTLSKSPGLPSSFLRQV